MSNKGLIKFTSILSYVLLAVSVVLVVIFYMNTGSVNGDDPWNIQMDQLGPILNYYVIWSYILVGLAVFLMLIFPIINMITNPKKAVKSLVFLVIGALLLFAGYSIASDIPIFIPGYEGTDNSDPLTLKLTGMGLYTTYVLVAGSILSMLFYELKRTFSK